MSAILWVIMIYSLAMIGIGLYFRKTANESLIDYWVAGRNVKPFIGGLALYSTYGSAHTLMGVIGLGYTLGVTVHQFSMISAGLGLALGAFLLGAPIQRYGQLYGRYTMTDYLTERYESKAVNLLVPVFVSIMLISVIGMQLYAGALATSYLTGISFRVIAVVITVSFLLYTMLGGMYAVTITNVVQTFLMIIFTFIPCVAVLLYFDGWSNLVSKAVDIKPYIGGSKLGTISLIGAILTFSSYTLGMPTIIMRVFTSNNVRTSRSVMAIAGICGNLNYMFAIPIVLAAVVLFPTLKNPDFAYIAVANAILPSWVVGCCIVAIYAALMSTTDAMLLAVGASVGRDILNVIKPGVTDKQRKKVTMITQLVVGLIGLLIALNPPGLISVIVSMVSAAIGATFGPALVGGIWWKRATKSGAIASMLVGLGTVAIILFAGIKVPPLTHSLYALPLSIATFIIVSLLTKPASETTIHKTCSLLHKNSGDSNDSPALQASGG